MTSSEIYDKVSAFAGMPVTIICDLHSACSPAKRKSYLCLSAGSKTKVVDFDKVKTQADIAKGLKARKSVDALTVSPSKRFLCFIELKSWELLLTYSGTEDSIRRQVAGYSSDLPLKLDYSIQICKEITGIPDTFSDCEILYILLTDISVADNGIMAFNSDLTALAGTSSKLKQLCNSLSQGVMSGISTVETRYWECRNLDSNMANI
jgi:hypothetical protein